MRNVTALSDKYQSISKRFESLQIETSLCLKKSNTIGNVINLVDGTMIRSGLHAVVQDLHDITRSLQPQLNETGTSLN